MKLNLLKKLLCLSPVLISPVLVTACGSEAKKPSNSDNFYLSFYKMKLNEQFNALKTTIADAAKSSTHQYQFKVNVITPVLNACKKDGASEFKKQFPDDTYNEKLFDQIVINFATTGNLKLSSDLSTLMVYPNSVITSSSAQELNYTLQLKGAKTLIDAGSLVLNLSAGFVPVTFSPVGVTTVYGNNDLSTILVGTKSDGLSVGTRQANGSYNFINYNTFSASKLANNDVTSIFATSDLTTIFVAEMGGGLDVGVKQNDNSYQFTNYDTSSSNPLSSDNLQNVTGGANGKNILISTQGYGIDIGIQQDNGSYSFTGYNTGNSSLVSNEVFAGFTNRDLSTILLGTDSGISKGTQSNNKYTFTSYNTGSGLASNDIKSIFASSDLKTLVAGTISNGISISSDFDASSPTFKTYDASSGLAGNDIKDVFGNQDATKILVAEGTNGLDIGSKTNSGYTFKNYSSADLSTTAAIYGNSDLSSLLVGSTNKINISSDLWFA